MGKDCGRGNEQLDAKALWLRTRRRRGGGRVENVSRLPGWRISFEMCRIKATGYLRLPYTFGGVSRLNDIARSE